MPIYEYRCGGCDARVEILVRHHTATPACPECGTLLTDKLFSAPHILSSQAKQPAGATCCGREERCSTPPCSEGGSCRHD